MILSLGLGGPEIKKKKKKRNGSVEVALIEAFAEETETKPNLK